MDRESLIERKTNETDISLLFKIDGSGIGEIETGIGFFDHMLTLFSRHGLFDVKLKAKGDLNVDAHHTVEDIGIVLGQAIKKALGDKKSIKRYGSSFVPMDESLALCAIDVGGRPFVVFDAQFTSDKVGEMETDMIVEFFRAIAFNSGINLHIKVFYGGNNHHISEAIFKAFAKALDEATSIDKRIEGVLSTKGML
ncbi:MAG: imidazoleglycerol-phosphate dehydratase HisB [Clostridia bacterium]|jgi:imidazoleglycerol-phosphate dehydratase